MPTARALLEADRRLATTFGRYSRRLSHAAAADPLDELIECLVNQRTTHAAAGRALAAVRACYPTWAAVAAAAHDHLANLLRPAGLADMKAGRVQAVLQQVYTDTGDFSLTAMREWPTDQAVRFLRTLPGVGPHTAALVVLFALRRRGVFPVEEAIRRVAVRLRWALPAATALQVQRAVEAEGAGQDLTDLHVNLIRLGRRHCRADAAECWECPLSEVCPSSTGRHPLPAP